MLSFEEARKRLLERAGRVGEERVGLFEASGRVLSQPLRASFPLPNAPRSVMDGYALASSSLEGPGPWRLRVSGESRAGGERVEFVPGTACRIFTGAVLPDGADCVVAQEDVERQADEILLRTASSPGTHVRARGSELAEGALALEAGTRLGPGALSLAAMLGVSELRVSRAPLVTIVCTGDELRSAGESLGFGGIYESNGVLVSTLARAAGAKVRMAPFARDDPKSLEAVFSDALEGTDVLVSIGGVSVGDHDGVRDALERCGVTLDFWRVAMKPGKPLAVGTAGKTHVLGLPGNPGAALVTFALFGMPLLRSLQGDARPLPEPFSARLGSEVRRGPGRTEFARARLVGDEVVLHSNQSSGAATNLAFADCLAVLPAESEFLPKGSEVRGWRLAEL